jgi:hypothetical protein
MQFFGARCNLPKLLLYTMNSGKDEVTGDQAGPAFPTLKSGDGPLKYDEVVARLDEGMAWLAKLYCNTMNVIHYMHDKYDYERIQVRAPLLAVILSQPNASANVGATSLLSKALLTSLRRMGAWTSGCMMVLTKLTVSRPWSCLPACRWPCMTPMCAACLPLASVG